MYLNYVYILSSLSVAQDHIQLDRDCDIWGHWYAGKEDAWKQEQVVVCWLLYVPATGECITGRDLLRRFYVLPHWDRSCRSNFPSHPVTVYWHQANQSQHWPYNTRRLAGYPLKRQFFSHWYDSILEIFWRKQDLNPGSSALEADALTTRPSRWAGTHTIGVLG